MATQNIIRTKKIPAEVEPRLVTEVATVQIIRLDWQQNVELMVDPLQHYQIDLCLSARLQGMSVCYPRCFGERRFERIGELMMIPPGEELISRRDVSAQTPLSSHASTVLTLAPELVSAWCDDGDPVWAPEPLAAALDITDQSMYSLMTRLTRETLNAARAKPTAASLALVDLIARQIGIEISRLRNSITELEFKGGLSAWRLRLIDERAQQIAKPPSIDELASLCKISTRQLQRGFRVSRGCSIGQHIEHCRIDNAKRLLLQGIAISEVAEQLGFASHSSFSYAFRRVTGETPAQFRRLM